MSIWLSANLEAHAFVDSEYWRGNCDAVKAMIPQAEVYVSEDQNGVNGFIGVVDDYIAGIFVDASARTAGIGSQLLDRVRQDRKSLRLSVYKKNKAAVSFYRKRGFQIDKGSVDPETAETEYTMVWNGQKGGTEAFQINSDF